MKDKRNVEKLKKDAKVLSQSSKEVFVDYVNDITDKVQSFTADKLENLEEKAIKALDSSKASVKSQSRTINNMLDKNSNEFKSVVDTILFE